MTVTLVATESLLWLLTVRSSDTGRGASAARLERVDATFEAAVMGPVAFRPAVAFTRPGLGFSATISATCVVAAIAADFAGETGFVGDSCFEGLINLRGDAGRERYCFWGEPNAGRTGD